VSQTAGQTQPFDINNLISPTLDSIVRAISERGRPPESIRLERGNAACVQILSFVPRDAVDLMLAGQSVLFNELLADAARDVLHGMEEERKVKAIATAINLGRLTQGHLDRLNARGNQPFQTCMRQFVEDPHPAAHASAIDAGEPSYPPLEKARASQQTEPPAATPPQSSPVPDGRGEPEPLAAAPPRPSPAPNERAETKPLAATNRAASAPARQDAHPKPIATAAPASPEPAPPEAAWLDPPHADWRIEPPSDQAFREAQANEPRARRPFPHPVGQQSPVMDEAAGD
jgi:hypothetical protein